MSVPFIYCAFSNDSKKKFLPFLLSEMRGIRQKFFNAERLGQIESKISYETSVKDFHEHLSSFGDRISFLHFSGHAWKEYLALAGEQFSNDQIEMALSQIEAFKKLEVVFLNGCHTDGLADIFIRKGAKIVIASTRDVPDDLAAQFSINFYEDLCKSLSNGVGYSVKASFDGAASLVPPEFGKVEITPILRNIEDENPEPAKPGPLWRIYHAGDVLPEIRLIRKSPSAVKSYTQAEQEILDRMEELNEIIENNERKISESPEDQVVLDRLKKYVSEREEKYVYLMRGNDKTNADNSLKSLNYKEQLSDFLDKKGMDNEPRAFLLSGTDNCGLGFLVELLLETYQIEKYGEKEVKYVKVDFSSRSTSKDNPNSLIWDSVAIQLKMPSDPDSIVKACYDQFLAGPAPKNLVFIFDRVEYLGDMPAIASIITNFWYKFVNFLQKKNLLRKIFLFIVDRGLKPDPQFGNIIIQRKYDGMLIQDEIEKKAGAYIMNKVDYLQQEDLQNWYLGQAWWIARHMDQKQCFACLDEIGRIRPTLISILTNSGFEDTLREFEAIDDFAHY